MKRHDPNLAGGAKVREPSPDLASRSGTRGGIDVASFRPRPQDAASSVEDDAALIEDFIDFLAGEDAPDLGALPAPDPAFQERLRRRLWRNYVVAHLRKGNETH